MIEKLLSEINEDKHMNLATTSNKFKTDLWNFFLKPNFSSMRAIEFGTHKGQTTRVLAHLFKEVITINLSWAHLASAMELNADLDNIRYVPFDLYQNEHTTNPVDDVIDVFFIDAGHEYWQVHKDLARAMAMNTSDIPYVIFDDYGMMDGVYEVVTEFDGVLTIVQEIGHEAGHDFGGDPPRILKRSEGVICQLDNRDIVF